MKRAIITSALLLFAAHYLTAQSLSGIYKVNDLFKRIENTDTLYVLNFWATWCKPCMEELKGIDSVGIELKQSKTKLVFVNLDFIEKKGKVNQVLRQKNIQSQCVLLDEVNGNAYIDRISEKWSGEIPTTVLINGNRKLLLNKKMNAQQLRAALVEFSAQ